MDGVFLGKEGSRVHTPLQIPPELEHWDTKSWHWTGPGLSGIAGKSTMRTELSRITKESRKNRNLAYPSRQLKLYAWRPSLQGASASSLHARLYYKQH